MANVIKYPGAAFPFSFARQNSAPLDNTAVLATVADINTYAANADKLYVPYRGQIISCEETDSAYILTLSSGKLVPKAIVSDASSVDWSKIINKPTTIAGYGILDLKIVNGVITIGSSTITPITSLAGYATEAWVSAKGYLVATTTDKANWNKVITDLSAHIADTTKHITTTERTNWNTAYGWGNHASGGYAKATALNSYILTSQKGVANGVVPLGADTKIASTYLPSYVDDVLEYANKAAFPATGESGKIYVAADSNLAYRWSGSAYVTISQSLALGETSSTAYAGNKGAANATAIAALKAITISAGTGLTGGGNLTANRSFALATVGTAGTFTKVTVDAYGRVTGNTILVAADIPVLPISKITSLQTSLDAKLSIAEMNKWFTIQYNTNGTIKSIQANFDFYSVGEVSAYGSGSGTPPTGAQYLYELGDVTITNPTNKQTLVYDAQSAKWINGAGLSAVTVKLGTTSYNGVDGVVSLPAYPTTLPASDVYAWAKAITKPSYTWVEIGSKQVATTTTAGIVKIGSNIIVSADGTISIAAPSTSLPWGSITGKPTTIEGYGITNGVRTFSLTSGASAAITTADFIAWLKSIGAFQQYVGVWRGTWDYSNNKYISDTGIGFNIPLAGAVVEVFSQKTDTNVTIRITTATTSSGMTLPGIQREFIYVYNGPTYSPGWRVALNSVNYVDYTIQKTDARLTDARKASDVYAWAKAATKPAYAFSEITGKPTTLSGYGITDAVTLSTIQDITGIKTFAVGKFRLSNTESNTVEDISKVKVTGLGAAAGSAIERGFAFSHYTTWWKIGNVRGDGADTVGFGIANEANVLAARISTGGIVANSFIKHGGTSSQLLKANGTVLNFSWSSTAGSPFYVWGTAYGNETTSVYATSQLSVASSKSFTHMQGTNVTGGWDANALVPTGGGISSQYGSGGYWKNAPSGLEYGTILTLGHNTQGSLRGQFAWDIDHNVDNGRNGLFFRTSNNLGWNATWDRILTNRTWASVVDGRYLPLTGGTLTGQLNTNSVIRTSNWFDNSASGIGLYNSAQDARWRAQNGRWEADKQIYSSSNFVAGSTALCTNLNADLLDGQHLTAISSIKNIVTKTDYQHIVILLWKDEDIAQHRITGQIYTDAQGSNRYQGANINFWFCRWSSGYDYAFNLDGYYIGQPWRLITCTYGGKKWWGLRGTNTQANTIRFVGTESNIEWTPVVYYTEIPATVNNAEINGSIALQDSLVQSLSKGGFVKYATLNDNVASATKLQNARSIWGQSFDGTANISGALTGVTTITANNVITAYAFKSIGSNSITSTFGAENSSYCHIRTNAPTFYMDKGIELAGKLMPYGSSYDMGTGASRWGTLYINSISTSGTVNTVNLASSGLTTLSQVRAAYDPGTYISMATRQNVITSTSQNTANSAHSLIVLKNVNGSAITYGGIGATIGFYGYSKSTIDNNTNNYTWLTGWNVDNGALSHTGTMTLSSTLTVSGAITANSVIYANGGITGSISGNASTASKLATSRTINGTSFDGTAGIKTSYWGSARTFYAGTDCSGSVLVDGSLNPTLPITVNVATKLRTTRAINGTNFDGTAAITTATWGTARTFTFGTDCSGSYSTNGSANVTLPITVNLATKLRTARTITLSGSASGSTTYDGSANSSIAVTLTGNAPTATILATTRTIWGQSFNGSANVTGALSGATTGAFSSNVTIGGTLNVTGNITSNAEVTAYSDVRLKTDVKDLVYRGRLQAKTFIKDSKRSIGFIAQDIQILYPELVQINNPYLSLNYGAITAVLSVQLNTVEDEVSILKIKVKQLEDKLNKYERNF